MGLKMAGKLVLVGRRQIALEGHTVITLNPEDQVLEIISQTGVDARLLQMYPFVTEGRMLWIWNNSGATVTLGRANTDPGFRNTAYDFPGQTMPPGRVLCFRFYVHGGLQNSAWPTWHQV